MWLRCCCCCCPKSNEKRIDFNDSSSLISDGTAMDDQVHSFYVPRRHSSFQPSTRPQNAISVQLGKSQSDCSSTSEEEGVPEKRGRCWSATPDTSVADVSAFIANRGELGTTTQNRSPSTKFLFDRCGLSEIAELEQGDEECGHSPKMDSEVCGYVTFTSSYDKQEQRLTVHLKRASDLPKKSEEPYGTFVKLSLTSSGKNFRLSRPVKKTLCPTYDEEHVFHTNRSKWKTPPSNICLRLSVFDCDRQGRHDAIGHALLPLDDIGFDNQEHCLPLTPMSLPVRNLGQILLGLLYSPIHSRLSVHAIKARHLRVETEFHRRHLRPLTKDMLDTFCKVTLTCGGQKVKTCRSRSAIGPDPFFDFRTNFVVPPQYLKDTSIIVSIVFRSSLGRQGTTLGRTAPLGPYVQTDDTNATQWGKMIREGRSVVQWKNIYL